MMRNFLLRIIPLALAMVGMTPLFSQELELPLQFNAEANRQYQEEQRFAPRSQRMGASLPIPFFDDFSRNLLTFFLL